MIGVGVVMFFSMVVTLGSMVGEVAIAIAVVVGFGST